MESGDRTTRRQLLSAIGMLGGSAALYHAMTTLGHAAETQFDGPPRLDGTRKGASVIVLGAGLAGMLAAFELRKAGYQVGVAVSDRSGVLQVNNISDLFNMAEVLGKQPRPKGPRLTIVTNAGGPGVLATDALISAGGELTAFNDDTIAKLNEFLPSTWSHGNPVDVIGDATAERYVKTLEVVAGDPQADGMLVCLTPQAMTEPTKIADQLKDYAKLGDKPVLASWMGGPEVAAGEAILNAAGIPTFAYPDTAARMFYNMWRYQYSLKALYETPVFPQAEEEGAADTAKVEKIIEETIVAEGQILLGWRDVPVDNSDLGESVKPTEPFHRQVFIGRGADVPDEESFERAVGRLILEV